MHYYNIYKILILFNIQNNMQNKKFFKSPNDKTYIYVFIISNSICLSIFYKNIMHLHNT